MKEFRSQAKSSGKAKMRAMMGGNSGKSSPVDSGQAVDKQKVPTRAFGGLVAGADGGFTTPNGVALNAAQAERWNDVRNARAGQRLDRPPRIGVAVTPPRPDPVVGAPNLPQPPVGNFNSPGLPPRPTVGMAGGAPGTIAGGMGGARPPIPDPGMGLGVGMARPPGMIGRAMPDDNGGMIGVGMRERMGLPDAAKYGGAIMRAKGGAVKAKGKKAPPFPPKAGAGSGQGRMQDAAAQKKKK